MTNSTSLSAYFENRMIALNPRIRKPASADAYRTDLRILQRYFESEFLGRTEIKRPLLLSDLSADLLNGAAAWQVRQGRSSATANRLLRHVLSIWRFAKEDETLQDAVPVIGKVRKHKEPKRQPEAWSQDQFALLVAAASRMQGNVGDVPERVWWPCLLLVAYWTGVRVTALMEIPSSCVDFERNEIRVPAEIQKHFADQGFELPTDVMELLRQIDPVGRGLTTVFEDWKYDRTCRPWKRLSKHLGQIITAAGFKPTRKTKFHQIRRTTATFIAAKRGIGEAQAFLGHSSSQTTLRYIDQRFMERPRVTSILPHVPVPVSSQDSLRIVG